MDRHTPEPSSCGPYRILRRLGRGGMGIVYEAEDQRTLQRVALKTVRAPKAWFVSSIRREIRALARLSHPDVIRILDEGVERGVPWYAMELLQGVTLRRLMSVGFDDAADFERSRSRGEASEASGWAMRSAPHDWWTHGLSTDLEDTGATGSARGRPCGVAIPFGTAVNLVRRLCGALAYLHGEGIIHRDLKPENVVVRADGRPALVDFGTLSRFAAAGDREALERSGEIVGTAHYMSPEQAIGDLVDARSDLYSLGCILYELLSGSPPFQGSAADVVRRHIDSEPVPLVDLVPGLPPGLDEIVRRLLTKVPRERPRHALSVAGALLPFDPSPDPQPAGGSGASAAGGGHFHRSALLGRGHVLSAIESHLVEASQGRGTLAVLIGESGMGKTRVAMEVGNRALRLGLDVHPCVCRRTSKLGEMLLPKLLEPIVDACREGGRRSTRRLLGAHASVLAALHPGILELRDAKPAEPGRGESATDPQRILDAMRDCWRAYGALKPRLWIIDDVHLADELSLGFLLHLVRSGALADRPILVLVTCRTRRENPHLVRLISRAPARFELGPLRGFEVAELASAMLALPDSRPLLTSALAQRAGGNPGLLSEYLRAAVDEGLLRHDGREGWTSSSPEGERGLAGALPSSLAELLERRASHLTGTGRRVAEACSILGPRIEVAAASRVSGLPQEEVASTLDELERRGLLETAEGESFRFVHAELATILERSQAPEARREGHRAAAEYLELAVDREDWLGELGRHYREAGDAPRARPLLRQAALEATARHATDTARELFQMYLDLEDPATREGVDARIRLAEGVLMKASPEEAERVLSAAVTEARRIGDVGLEARALAALGRALHVLGNVPAAREALVEAAASDRARGDRQALAAVLTDLGNILRETGEVTEAERCYQEALDSQEGEGDPDRLGALLGAFAALRYERGQLEEAAELFARAAALFRQTGNQRAEGLALANLAGLRTEQARWEEAGRLLATALESHRAVGDLRLEASTLSNLGVLASDRGFHREAIAYAESSVRIARELGATRLLGMCLLNLASFRFESGVTAGVEALCLEALGYLREVSERRLEGIALCVWADVSRRSGDPERAGTRYEAALERLRGVGDRGWEAKALVGASICARWRGDLALARRLAQESVRLHRESGHSPGLVQALCALARVDLAEEQVPAALLQEARELTVRAKAPLPGRSAEALDSLERSVDAARRGRPLLRGELAEDLPRALASRLAEA